MEISYLTLQDFVGRANLNKGVTQAAMGGLVLERSSYELQKEVKISIFLKQI